MNDFNSMVNLVRRAKQFSNRIAFIQHCVQQAPPGIALEFGVGDGGSARVISSFRPLYAFDSFEGLPERWNKDNPKGKFNMGGKPPLLPENVKIIVGWFNETLPKFIQDVKDIALVNIDCDIYSSAKCVLDHVGDKLVDGAILMFDEFWDYPEQEHHEAKAFLEWQKGKKWECIARNGKVYTQAAFRIFK